MGFKSKKRAIKYWEEMNYEKFDNRWGPDLREDVKNKKTKILDESQRVSREHVVTKTALTKEKTPEGIRYCCVFIHNITW